MGGIGFGFGLRTTDPRLNLQAILQADRTEIDGTTGYEAARKRAQQFAERHNNGTRDIVDALNDIRDRLGEKGRLADLHASYKAFQRLSDIGVALYEAILNDPTPENQNRYDDFILAVDGWGRNLDAADLEWRLKRAGYDHERLNDGVDQQDE